MDVETTLRVDGAGVDGTPDDHAGVGRCRAVAVALCNGKSSEMTIRATSRCSLERGEMKLCQVLDEQVRVAVHPVVVH
jgi:hypothetical protein